MKNKIIILSLAVVLSLSVGSAVLAQAVGKGSNTNNQATVSACVASAVVIRETAIQSAFSTF